MKKVPDRIYTLAMLELICNKLKINIKEIQDRAEKIFEANS